MTFESLKKWNLKTTKNSSISLNWIDKNDLHSPVWVFNNLEYKLDVKQLEPEITLINKSGGLHISPQSESKGSVWIEFKLPANGLKMKENLVVEGARILSIEQLKPDSKDKVSIIDSEKMLITGAGEIKVNFENLIAKQTIKIYVKSSNGSNTKPIEYTVAEAKK